MRRRLFLLLLVLVPAVFIAASASQSRVFVTSATVTITGGEGFRYTVVLTNTGTDVIKCMRFFAPPGITISSVTGPPGTRQEDTGVFSNGSLVIEPTASATWTIAVSGAITAASPPRINVSSDCRADFAAQVVVQEPPPPCKCSRIETSVTRVALNFTDSSRYHFQLVWKMTCVGQVGRCNGQVHVIPPPGFRITTPAPRKLPIRCVGTCAKVSSQPTFIGGPFPRNFRELRQRRNRTIVFRFRKVCIVDGRPVPAGIGRLTVVYNRRGITDQKRSDFNGDGFPDRIS
jgi:hypothetical protein